MTAINLKNVTLNFRGQKKPALNRINYTVKKGDFIILLGSNGSGKSTLLKLLHRYHTPNTGEIFFADKLLTEYSLEEFNSQVAVLTQNCDDSLFNSLTVYENYLLVKRQKSQGKKHDKLFLQNYLREFNENLAEKLDCFVEELSGGEKQALALALCLYHPPALLLLDEHTSALDPKTSEQIMQLTQKMVRAHRITCILTTHNLDIALRFGSRILILHEGTIFKTYEKEEKTQLTKEMLFSNYSERNASMGSNFEAK